MGKVTVKTRESAGQVTYETEIVYEDSTDFFFVEEEKRTAMSQNIQNFVGGMYTPESGDEPMVADVVVTKKTKETKH
jgi:hypothetical protein